MSQVTKEKDEKTIEVLTVDTHTLMSLLGAGRKTATEIGDAAGARICIGKDDDHKGRLLWNVGKLKQYIDSISA